MYYELANLTVAFGTLPRAAIDAHAFATDPAAGGELLGCWASDIGVLNQLIVLRGFDDLDALQSERQRTLHSADPYGCGDRLQQLDVAMYRAFDGMRPVRPSEQSGLSGPVYEIRTYGFRPGGVRPTIDLWAEYLPGREALSRCVVAMVALDGPPRFTNIWAYDSLDSRSRIRAEAVARGVWPPKGGPAWLTTDMRSAIVLPTDVSPLR